MTTDTRHFSWRNFSWLTLALGLAAVISFLAVASPPSPYPVPIYGVERGAPGAMTNTSSGISGPSAPAADTNTSWGGSAQMTPVRPYPYPQPAPPVGDTREFDKVTYAAQMKTRDIALLEGRVATVVRGHAGRVDAEQVSPEYGYVSFVVPVAQYEAFRAELEGLVGSRFLSVSVNAENLLPEKQSIESQQAQASTTLAQYQSQRSALITVHASRVAAIQAQLNPLNQQLSNLQEQPPNAEVVAQIQYVENQIASLNASLASENDSYQSQLAPLDAQVKSIQDWQQGIASQDKALADNIATVNGSITLTYISLWELIHAYLPGYAIPAVLALLAGLSARRDRQRFYRRELAAL